MPHLDSLTGRLPRGFLGAAPDHAALLPRGRLRHGLPAAGSGDSADHAGCVLSRLPPDSGELSALLRAAAATLRDGGRLLVDAAATTAPARIRALLEPETTAPRGGAGPDERTVTPLQLLDAASDAGLVVRDLVGIPGADALPPGFAEALRALGIDSAPWYGPRPPARLWLCAERRRRLAGSVLLGGAAADAPDTAALAAALPPGWQLLPIPDPQPEAIDRAIADSDGDVLWFVPAGAALRPTDLRRAASVLLDRPLRVADAPGRLTGLAIARRDALRAGPLHVPGLGGGPSCTDDWFLRLDRLGCAPRTAPPADAPPWPAWPQAPHDPPGAAERLAWRWNALPRPGGHSTAHADAAPRLALCMIVRDEADELPECLRRARTWCDELIVVDTGSHDATPRIAADHGARVLHEPWRDDFAAARNVALRAADACDWVLVLDADERVDPDDAPRVRRALNDPRHIAWSLRMRCPTGDGSGPAEEFWLTRLFRNLPGVEFDGRIHEQVVPSLQRLIDAGHPATEVGRLDVVVEHRGYLAAHYAARDKAARNTRLFELQLAEHPDDAYTLLLFAEQLLQPGGDPARAATLLDRARTALAALPDRTVARLPFAAQVHALCARQRLTTGDVEGARQIVDTGLERTPHTPDLLHVAGLVALASGDPLAALGRLRACLAWHGRPLPVRVAPGVTGAETWMALADAELRLQHVVPARAALQRAAELAGDALPECRAVATAQLALLDEDPARALQQLTDQLQRQPHSPRAAHLAAGILERLGHADPAAKLRACTPA